MREVTIWRYRVSVVVDVLGSFEREVRAQDAQMAAATVVAAMGDQGPWGGRSMPLDPWLHGAEIKVRVECLDLAESCAPLPLPDPTIWTLYTTKKADAQSGGSGTDAPPATPREINPAQVEIAPAPPEVCKAGGGSAYPREQLAAALTWIERNVSEGIALVARALSSCTWGPTADALPPLPSKAGGTDAQLCRCGHQRQQHDFDETVLAIPCFALVADRVCPCTTFERAKVRYP